MSPIHCWSHTILSMRRETFVVISFLSPNLKKSSLLNRSQIRLLLCMLSLSELKPLSSVSGLLSPTSTFLPNAHPTHTWQVSSQNTDRRVPSLMSWVNLPAAQWKWPPSLLLFKKAIPKWQKSCKYSTNSIFVPGPLESKWQTWCSENFSMHSPPTKRTSS